MNREKNIKSPTSNFSDIVICPSCDLAQLFYPDEQRVRYLQCSYCQYRFYLIVEDGLAIITNLSYILTNRFGTVEL